MRIGVVTTSYPRWPGDAAGGFVAEHVAAMQARGAIVDVIAAGEGALFYGGGAPDALDRATPALVFDAASFSLRLAAAVARRAPRWDAVVAHWLAPSAIAALPSRGPLLAIAHGGDVHVLIRSRLLAPAIAMLAARRARVVAVSRDLLARMIAAAPRPLARWLARTAIVQSMGIDAARFAALPDPPPARTTIAVIGRLVTIKGIDVAIDAMASLAHRDVRLAIAGDGPLARELAARAAGKPIDLLGALDGDARDRLLGRASIVVVPSRPAGARVEGMPVVAIEALAAGRAVVASATGGLRELPAPARLVPPGDARALAAAIDDALVDPPPADACRRSIADRDWPIVERRLSDHWFS